MELLPVVAPPPEGRPTLDEEHPVAPRRDGRAELVGEDPPSSHDSDIPDRGVPTTPPGREEAVRRWAGPAAYRLVVLWGAVAQPITRHA